MQMAASRLELLLHPVRMRLVNAMHAAGTLTTAELCSRLPDLPKATVYRQIERLVGGGVFQIESVRQVRGATERRYRLTEGGGAIRAGEARSMTLEDHRRAFTAAMAALIADFNAYLDRRDSNPLDDAVSYRHFTLWLKPGEHSRLVRDVGQVLTTLMKNKPGADRAPYRISSILFPIAETGRAAKKSGRRRS
jgi:hypothetical protein